MARFIGRIKGTRGEATRLGSEKNGIIAHVNGWNSGVTVYASTDINDRDCFEVHFTGGSNAATNPKLIVRIEGKVVESFK